LEPSLNGSLGLLYIAAFAVAFVGECCFLALVPIDKYHQKSKWIFSPVTIIGVLLNLIAAAAAYAMAPEPGRARSPRPLGSADGQRAAFHAKP
jgi:hypothetical protein